MKILNPFKLQNWDYKKFLIVILGIQLSLLGLFGIEKLGIETQILRAFVGCIYIFVVPGYLILRILKLNKINSLESFLYSVGLSVFFVMVVGFLINALFPIMGITNRPISEIPVILSTSVSSLLLLILSYFVNSKSNDDEYIDLKDILNPQVLGLSLIPFMAIFGTYLVNNYSNNILLMVMIMLLSIVILNTGVSTFFHNKYYPFILWITSISLILHVILFTDYLPVNDIVNEYIVANTTLNSSIWDINNRGVANYGSVLSVSLFTPFLSIICGIDLMNAYKIIIPLVESIIPLTIYSIYSKYSCKRYSFLAAYLFLSVQPFFMQTILIPKQSISLLFLSLLLNISASKVSENKKVILVSIYMISLIVSHYGTAYLVMVMLIFGVFISKLLKKIYCKELIKQHINWALVSFYVLILIGWYIYIANSEVFNSFVRIGGNVCRNLIYNFLNPNTRGAELLTKSLPLVGTLIKYSYLGTIGLITIGYLREIVLKIRNNSKYDVVYLAFSSYWFVILGASFAIPSFAVMGPTRLFCLSLVFLAPFAITGSNTLFKNIGKVFQIKYIIENSVKFITSFLVMMMLLNTGFVSEVIKEPTFFKYINYQTAMEYGTIEDKVSCVRSMIFTQNILSGKWLSKNRDPSKNISRLDVVQGSPSLILYGNIDNKILDEPAIVPNIPKNVTKYVRNVILSFDDVYIQLTYANVVYDLGWLSYNELHKILPFKISEVSEPLDNDIKIYDNSGSQIFIS
ncbi:DUF2206 domain-containing protein [Methanococcus maripaludis]|uniref:DUF2206 domain-containing protein n=2 Tax=Methanococcus maripaludis TaxID=39152 RepID=A6VJ00_METM7|nr:DUF2206 domain-containing protein [Methanococcus maripaludis]MBA2862301.1 putative membrane protein [Methanococcus maripaludis]